MIKVNTVRLEGATVIPSHKELALELAHLSLEVSDDLFLLSPLTHPAFFGVDVDGMDNGTGDRP